LSSTRKSTVLGASRDRREKRRAADRRLGLEIGRSSVLRSSVYSERKTVGVGLDEEIERIDHGHLGDEVDLDLELGGLLRKDEARQPVAVRILLPVHEMIGGVTLSE
jgi:hypothetical protein